MRKWFLEKYKDKPRRLESTFGALLLILLLLLSCSSWLKPLDQLFLDLHFHLRGSRPFPSQVIMVGIDESSLDVFGRWPWSRDKHAALVGLFRHDVFSPRVIAYDLLFEYPQPEETAEDQSLVFQTKHFDGSFVTAYFFEKTAGVSGDSNPEKEKFLESFHIPHIALPPRSVENANRVSLPFSELAQIVDMAFVNTPIEVDGRTRYARLLMKHGEHIYPSMDLLVSMRYLGLSLDDMLVRENEIYFRKGPKGPFTIPMNDKGDMLINYYGKASAIPSYSFVKVLEDGKKWMDGKMPPAILPEFKNKIALIGATALGLGDRRVTPLGQYETGISLHAQSITNILNQDFLREATPLQNLLWALVAGILTLIITYRYTITRSLWMIISLALLYFSLAQLLFLRGVWVHSASAEMMIAVLFTSMISFRYFMALEELKRTQAKLIHASKMAALGQLSAGTAHEFRNILNAIALNTEYGMRSDQNEEQVKTAMQRIQKTIANANKILNGLLIFARKSESNLKPGSLKKTLEETAMLIEKELLRHEIDFRTDFEEVPEISYDAGQISQVLINLLNNARDAVKNKPRPRRVGLKLKASPEGAYIEVSDNGSGIPPEVIKFLFQPFVTSKKGAEGTGLGLSICHGIIRNHFGEINVLSSDPRTGTTWEVFLPKSDSHPEA